jgi:two-component system, LytTR family, sensor kinase
MPCRATEFAVRDKPLAVNGSDCLYYSKVNGYNKVMLTVARLKLVILGWAGASFFFTAVLMVSDLGGHKPFSFALYLNAVHFGLWIFVLPLLSKCVRWFPLSHGKRIWNVVVLLPVVAALATGVMLSHLAIVYFTFFPYRYSFPTFRSILQSELVRFLPVDILIGIVLVLALDGWRVWLDLQSERTRATDLERQVAVSRLDALRMELHPHFLFNTLHAVAGLIVEQPPIARRMVIALGDLLRLTLKDTGGLVRSLAEELEFADLYLGIEKLRLGDHLVLDYDIEPEATSAEVPQLLLQPLFENAVRHGAALTLHSCEVRFRACRQDEELRLTLYNDGPVRPASSGSPPFGVGLTNTMTRLRLHYKDQFKLQYSDRPQGGVQIDISIPYKRADSVRVDPAKELYAVAPSAHAHADHR